jgi:ornithine decarboxylase/arginine decarboxylase
LEYARRFKVLVCVPAFDKTDLEGARLREILSEVERMEYAVVRAQDTDDAELVVRTDSAIGTVIVDWGKKACRGKATALISLVRKRGLDVPIILLVRRPRLEDIPVEVLDDVDGFVFLAEETPEFIAKTVVSRLRQYAETLKTFCSTKRGRAS